MLASKCYLNKYLNNCDLCQKYVSKNFYTLPELEALILEIPLDQFQLFMNNILKAKLNITFYFLFYIFLSYCSYINFLKKKKKDYSLKIILKNKLEIDEFIHQFFLHIHFNSNFKYFFNSFLADRYNKNNMQKKKKNVKYESIYNAKYFENKNNGIFLFNLKVPFLCLFNVHIYLDSLYENMDIKNFFIFCNFKFKNVCSKTKNFLFFLQS